MDRLLCESLSRGNLCLAKKLLTSQFGRSFRNLGTHSSKTAGFYVNQLSSIRPVVDSVCYDCLSSKFGALKYAKPAELSKVFRKEIAAVSAMMFRSEHFSSIFANQKQGDTHKGGYISLFHKSSGDFREKDGDGDRGKQERNPDKEQDQSENEEDNNKNKLNRYMEYMRYLIAGVILLAILMPTSEQQSEKENNYISWSEFYNNLLLKGEVKSITIHYGSSEEGEHTAVIYVHDGAVIKGHPTSKKQFLIKIPKGFKFEERIRQVEDQLGLPIEETIPIKCEKMNSWFRLAGNVVIALIVFSLLRAVFSQFTKMKGEGQDFMDIMSGGMRKAKFTRADGPVPKGVKAISFKDVAGLKEAKIEVVEFVDYLTKPERFKALGAKTPRGALLLGPPGCGKTLLARALATEAKVPFLAMAGSEFVEMIGGVGAARVRNLFKEAREKAPCIIYIDEIDAIGRSRGGAGSTGGGGEDEQTLNQLLVEMDGIGTQEGVCVLAATNRADILDKALLRPGRFDRHIMIDVPTLKEREEIFHVYLEKLKLTQPTGTFARPLSRLTPGMSGADIDSICNEAAIHAARDKRTSVEKEDFEYAIERVIAGVEKKSKMLSPGEKKVVAYHESGHALVGWMLRHTDALLKVSIVPRTNNALGFAQYLPSDQKLYSTEELFERMCMALGGRAAESLIFNHVSTGAHDDLQRVTKMAYAQIQSYGMNARVGHLSFPSQEEQQGSKPYSQRLAQTIDEEARLLVTNAFLHTQKVLEDNKDKLHKLATRLIEKEVLNYEDVQALIGPPVHGKKSLLEEPSGWDAIRMQNDNGNNNRS